MRQIVAPIFVRSIEVFRIVDHFMMLTTVYSYTESGAKSDLACILHRPPSIYILYLRPICPGVNRFDHLNRIF